MRASKLEFVQYAAQAYCFCHAHKFFGWDFIVFLLYTVRVEKCLRPIEPACLQQLRMRSSGWFRENKYRPRLRERPFGIGVKEARNRSYAQTVEKSPTTGCNQRHSATTRCGRNCMRWLEIWPPFYAVSNCPRSWRTGR